MKHELPTDRDRRFTQIFEADYGQVLRYVRRRVPLSAIDDVVAETFLAAWRNLDRVSGDSLPWLYSLARGAVANQRRRDERVLPLRDLASSSSSPDHSEHIGWEDSFAAAFTRLHESDREVLRITAWEGLTANQGAIALGCSITAFKVRLHRARKRLRTELAKEHEGLASSSPAAFPRSERDVDSSSQSQAVIRASRAICQLPTVKETS